MRVSFSQPVFLPWGGFFGRLLHSDLMIILDQTQFARGFTYVNRNRLKNPRGEIWITVPVHKKGLGLQTINKLRIFEPERWSQKFFSLLRHYYCHSIYFEETEAQLRTIFNQAGENFCALTAGVNRLLAEKWAIPTTMVEQPEETSSLKGCQLLLELARQVGANEVLLPWLADRHLPVEFFTSAGLKIIFLKYQQLPYPQFWGDFIPNLSALDLWLCCGESGRKILEKSCRLIRP